MPFRTMLGNEMAVWKRNPWAKIDKDLMKVQYMWSHVPSWTGNPALRPPGVKAVNDIVTYVRKHPSVVGLTVKGAVRVVGLVMKRVATFSTKAQVDSAIVQAIGITPEAIPAKLIGSERKRLREEARLRVPAYQKLAALLV